MHPRSRRVDRRRLIASSLATGALAITAPLLARPPSFATAATVSTRPAVRALTDRGTLLSAAPVVELDAEEVVDLLETFGLDSSRVRFGVDAFRIVYHTVDSEGGPTTASGLVALPRIRDRVAPMVAWLHGTRVFRGEVASVSEESDDRRFAFAFAAAGYAVAAPDYLGLGVGPGFHPWMDASSLATASVDALRATRTLAEREDRRVDGRVLVTGFSEGGNAAMALGRALQDEDDPVLTLGALATISGGYGWSAWVRSALDGEIEPLAATIYLGYLTVAWNRLYQLYDAPSEAFRAPYERTVEALFDNDHTIEQIFAAMPTTPEELLTPEFADRLRFPTGTLKQALQEADDVCSWRPQAPVQLYAASGDHEMPIASAMHCLEELEAYGADVTLIDVGDVDHFGSVMLSVPQVLTHFDELSTEG